MKTTSSGSLQPKSYRPVSTARTLFIVDGTGREGRLERERRGRRLESTMKRSKVTNVKATVEDVEGGRFGKREERREKI